MHKMLPNVTVHRYNGRFICLFVFYLFVCLFVSDIFTNNNVRRIMRELSDEQERRLQTKLDMNNSDIKKLYQQKDRRQRIREMVKMWLRRTYYPNETQLVKQLSEYFNQITDGTPINGKW